MAKGHRSQIKRARNENNRETRPSAKLSYARISVQKACYVLDAIRGKDVQTAPTMKRIQPRAQGRAYRIEKRTSHITVVLDER